MALTKRQKQVLDFIAKFVEDNGYCPSYDEIARGLELSSLATVHKHIGVLERVKFKPVEHWKARNAVKDDAGFKSKENDDVR